MILLPLFIFFGLLFLSELVIYSTIKILSKKKNLGPVEKEVSAKELINQKFFSLSSGYAIGQELEFVLWSLFLTAIFFLIPLLLFFLKNKSFLGFEIIIFSAGVILFSYFLVLLVNFFKERKTFADY